RRSFKPIVNPSGQIRVQSLGAGPDVQIPRGVSTVLGPVGLTCALLAAASVFAQSTGEWPAYGGDPGGTRFSALDEINRQNVANLKPVWNFRTGDLDRSDKFREKAAFESTPIMVDGTLYLT